MISYVMIGTNDLDGTAKFYDALLGVLGASRSLETETFIAWRGKSGGPALCLAKPYDGNPATVGNGVMVSLTAESPEIVDAVHRKALELGARDEGAPGPRGGGDDYFGYFRDPDGNKLCAAYFADKRYSIA